MDFYLASSLFLELFFLLYLAFSSILHFLISMRKISTYMHFLNQSGYI